MSQKMIRRILYPCSFAVAVILLTAYPLAVLAQAPDIPDDPGVPIDGGLLILAGSAIAYGAKKLYRKNKNKNEGADVI